MINQKTFLSILQDIRYFVEEYVERQYIERRHVPTGLNGYCTYSAGLTCHLLQKTGIPIFICGNSYHFFCKTYFNNRLFIVDLTATQFKETANMPIVFIPENHKLSDLHFYDTAYTFNSNKELLKRIFNSSYSSKYFFNVKKFLKEPGANDLIKRINKRIKENNK